jgi:Holliday junction resolvasome RuvABC endonuclease subunit|tara:strand:+ start:13553 stop:14092 length:540 start_codon:yes stop_codon:yes gene_type:complete
MILGLDVSTTCVGLCVLDSKGNMLLLDHIILSKIKTGLRDKAFAVKEKLENINDQFDIKHIFIEECLLRYRMGASSIHTLMTLAKFNGIISYVASEIFDIIPSHILAPHARKVCGLKVTKEEKKEKGIKQIVLNHVKDELGDDLDMFYTRTNKPKPYMFDRADSWIIAKCGYLEQILQN